MLTPQEVSSRVFAKAVMGGYNMSMVDEFLDEVTRDYTAICRENAALKAQVKTLVEKVRRDQEDKESMCAALLNAQKMADTMVQEAENQKKIILENAEAEVGQKIQALREETALEEQKLSEARAKRDMFLAYVHDLYERELEQLNELSEAPVSTASAEQPEAKENAAEVDHGAGLDSGAKELNAGINEAQKNILDFVHLLDAGEGSKQDGAAQETPQEHLVERPADGSH